MVNSIPEIYIKNNFQKSSQTGEYASDIFNEEVLKDLCFRVTGSLLYTVRFVEKDELHPFDPFGSYNRGRLVYIQYNNKITIVTFSPINISSRNSPFQTIGGALSALNRLEEDINFAGYEKRLAYYFVHKVGSYNTDYAKFMLKILSTIKIQILNSPEGIDCSSFKNIYELIDAKNLIRERNSSNKSTHIILGANSRVEVYAKTYGANKYESLLLAVACNELVSGENALVVYEIADNSLSELPGSVHEIFNWLGIMYDTIDIELQRQIRTSGDSPSGLRSPSFISNMLDLHGNKKCFWCSCAVPQLIEAAHIWPINMIRNSGNYTIEDKYNFANDANNGIWLCRNHHKLFDSNLVVLDLNLNLLRCNQNYSQAYLSYLCDSFDSYSLNLNGDVNIESVCKYITLRNSGINYSDYEQIS